MSSDGKKFLACLVDTGGIEVLRRVNADLFEADEERIYNYILQHQRRHGVLPSTRTVERHIRARLPATNEPISYYLQRLYDRKLYTDLRSIYRDLSDQMSAYDMDAARESIDRMKAATRLVSPSHDLLNLQEAASLVMERYDVAHSQFGTAGIPSGWQTIDTRLGGFLPGDLISLIGRLGQGKTYLLLRMVLSAWLSGYSCLVVSMEMPIEQIAARLIGMQSSINPDYIRRGQLPTYVEDRLRNLSENIANADRLHIYAGSFGSSVSDIDSLIAELMPDIVYIDGAYILSPGGNARYDRNQKVGQVYDALKRMTITHDRPIVTTSQFSRQAGARGRDGSIETIGFTDAIAMHSSVVLSIKEGRPPFQTQRRLLECLKVREGESDLSFEVNYVHSPMNFDEVLEEQAAAEQVDLDWVMG